MLIINRYLKKYIQRQRSKRYFSNIQKNNSFWENCVKNRILLQEQVFNKIEYLLMEFGTREPCNRFDVGNSIEFIISDFLKTIGYEVKELPNAKRVDMYICNYGDLSIKYSSSGDITLHNSNGCINKDEHMTDLLLLTKENLCLLSNDMLHIYGINVSDYIENAGDSLKLKRKILKTMKTQNYPYIMNININVENCKNRLCSKVFYEAFNREYNNHITNKNEENKKNKENEIDIVDKIQNMKIE